MLGATVRGDHVTEVELESPAGARVRLAARTFIDGTYEGDLAAAAKAPYRVGVKDATSSASRLLASIT